MGPLERDIRVDARRNELLGNFNNHLKAVEELAIAHSLDLDVLTDIEPNLLDGTSRKGVQAFEFWKNLYEGLSNGPDSRYTVVSRFSSRIKPGCYGFGQETRYEVNQIWMRVFRDLTPEKIQFVKGDGIDTRSTVLIDQPSVLITCNNFEVLEEPVVLAEAVDDASFDLFARVTPELYNRPYVSFNESPIRAVSRADRDLYNIARQEDIDPAHIWFGEAYTTWYKDQLQADATLDK